MFQPGRYIIARVVAGESNPYGYLEIEATGETTYEHKFYSDVSGATWPIPSPTSTTSFTVQHTDDSFPDQIGDGTMTVVEWSEGADTSAFDVLPKEIGPGPFNIEIDGTLAAIAVNQGTTAQVQGYFGVSKTFPDWPPALDPSSVASLVVGQAESPAEVAEASNAQWGKSWNRRALDETYS
jgi:hypothetical protein